MSIPKKPYKVGVIGYGLSAKIFHIPFITHVSDFKLHAVVQRTPTPDNDVNNDHPGVKSYRSVEELLADEEVEVVIVTTAPDMHFEMAKAALEAGKNVVVEKPFTPTPSEASSLLTLSYTTGKLLTVYHNRRWDSDFASLSALIHAGKLGRVVEFETHFDRHRPEAPAASGAAGGGSWKTRVQPGGGAIFDLGTHLIDQVVFLFGMPAKVTAFIGSQRAPNPSGFEDSFTVHLHYPDGMLATAKAGVVSPEVEQLRFWVRGTKGSYRKFGLDVQEEQLKAGVRPGDEGYGVDEKEGRCCLTTVQKDGGLGAVCSARGEEMPTYVEFYKGLARALGGDKNALPVKPEDAEAVIRLIELAKESSTAGRTVDV